ncbi:Ni/Co efflux regulator RcnB [Sphingopyxis panaciterrae]|uniref:RcnB family protein n=1 Tax=Sphingopyxis panaciterrae TaxID=363841 RepID=UPI001423C9E7|nr:RcnB family protein [Sphingopyxis panaciterrae]NIJ35703.1 Ni/Co efflux regulator RcnB [Sphingopyxis panaciterrae]
MKRIATIALCLAAMLPAAAAQARDHRDDRRWDSRDHRSDRHDRDRDHRDRYDRDRHDRDRYDGRRHARQVEWRKWRRGDRFDRRYARDYQTIDYRRYRGLRPPPRGYHYVRSGNDAVLIAITSGIVAAVVANAIR